MAGPIVRIIERDLGKPEHQMGLFDGRASRHFAAAVSRGLVSRRRRSARHRVERLRASAGELRVIDIAGGAQHHDVRARRWRCSISSAARRAALMRTDFSACPAPAGRSPDPAGGLLEPVEDHVIGRCSSARAELLQ